MSISFGISEEEEEEKAEKRGGAGAALAYEMLGDQRGSTARECVCYGSAGVHRIRQAPHMATATLAVSHNAASCVSPSNNMLLLTILCRSSTRRRRRGGIK